jgi:hypothetical protein
LTDVCYHFGRRLQIWRRWIGYSRGRFAEALGLCKSAYCSVEDGAQGDAARRVLRQLVASQDAEIRMVALDWLHGDGEDHCPVTPDGIPIPAVDRAARIRQLILSRNKLTLEIQELRDER